jgi:6-hydroxycyclohex-1-ene-1-carbonyl-CoA dehydrogenase
MARGIAAHRWMMTAPNQPMVREAFDAAPADGEVVVAVAGCGVCHTDLGYVFDGVRTNHPLALTLGHEIAGRVVAAGAGADSWLGRAVIIPAVLPCGECDACKRGRPNICRRQKMPGNDIHGGFASHVVVPARGLCPVDEARLASRGLSLADVSVVADAVTTPYQAVVRAGVTPGSVAIVVGVGGVGGYSAQIAKAFGAAVIAIDVDPAKLAAIAEHGASLTLNSREHDLKSLKGNIGEFCKVHGLPSAEWTIFECSGSAAGQTTAFGLLTYGATLCVVGFTLERVELRLSNLMAFDARALGNWGCPPELYPAALALVLDGKINLAAFIEHEPLDDINAVFEQAHAHKLTRRAILVPHQ